MVNSARVSKFFPNPLNNQLAIVHRQGTDSSLIIIGFLIMVELVRIVIAARLVDGIPFLTFFGLVVAGFFLFLALTIVIRRYAYTSIMHGQGIYHPKFVISIAVALFASTTYINPGLSITLNFFVVLVGIDILIQNHLHDIVTRIGANSWQINCGIPVFQIPFERDITIQPNEMNEYNLLIRTSKTGKGILPPKFENLNGNQATKLLENGKSTENYQYYALYVVEPQMRSIPQGNNNMIQFYVTDNLEELKEVIYEMRNLIKFKFLN